MLFVSLLRWWYTDGWRRRVRIVSTKLDGVMDYFSIDLLLKTLFAPFRQDGVGTVDGPLEVKLRAFADQMISRLLGAIIRSVILIFGLVAIAFYALLGFAVIILWAFVPVAPVIGVGLAVAGVTF